MATIKLDLMLRVDIWLASEKVSNYCDFNLEIEKKTGRKPRLWILIDNS